MENREACAKLCFSTDHAKYWTFLPADKLCWVKTSNKGRKPNSKAVSGNRECGQAGKSTLDGAMCLLEIFKMIREFELSLKSISQCQEARRPHHNHLMRELVVVLVRRRLRSVNMALVVKMPFARYV